MKKFFTFLGELSGAWGVVLMHFSNGLILYINHPNSFSFGCQLDKKRIKVFEKMGSDLKS
jgi:hypothetical protein